MDIRNSDLSFSSSKLPIQFRFPIRSLELTAEPKEPNVFWVKERLNINRWTESQLDDLISGVIDQLGSGGQRRNNCLRILTNEVFDPLYSILYYLEEVSLKIRKELIQVLVKGLKSLTELMEKTRVIEWAQQNFLGESAVNELVDSDPQCRLALQIQNALSAYVYLITQFMGDYCKLKETKESNLTKGKRRVAKKNRTEDQERTEQDQQSIFVNFVASMDLFLHGIFKKKVHFIWLNQKIDEEFVKSIIKCGFELLEHNSKAVELKDVIFEVLQTCMSEYGDKIQYMQSRHNQKIIDLLYNQENLATPLAEFVGLVVERDGPTIANDIIRDLTKQIFNTDSSHETIGIKNIAKFLQKLSKRAPKAVYYNINNLLGFFDCEAYLLRQSLIKILTYTIIYVLRDVDQPQNHQNQDENNQGPDTEQQRKLYLITRDKFLELLLKRFQDKSAFCRIKVMKVFTKLTEENLVPRFMYMDLFTAVIGRLKDGAVQVRKAALRLYQQMVCIYAIIFDVDVTKGHRFPTMQQVLKDYQLAESDLLEAKDILAKQNERLNQFRSQIMMQHPNVDQAQLILILSQNGQFVQEEQMFKRQNELVENAETIKLTHFELGKFLTKMDDAGALLVLMLSSKTILDTVEVIKVFKFLHKYGFSHTKDGIRKMLTLVFSKDAQVQNAVIDCYQSLYFNPEVRTMEKVNNLLSLMKDATLTDVTCMEELLQRLIKNDVFEKQVFNILWKTYIEFGRNFNNVGSELNQEERRRKIQECKSEQRSAIQLLRIMGSHRVEILLDQKEKFYETFLKFANYDSPDYIIMKEAMLAFEKIIEYQVKEVGDKGSGVTDNDKRHLYLMLNVIGKNFGTQDLEWFCAAEAVLNTLFNLKNRLSHEQSKLFLDMITRKFFRERSEEEIDALRQQPEDVILQVEACPLREDLSDQHYSQLFFVVGHIAIKMLTYVEMLESDLKKSLYESYKSKAKKKKRQSSADDDENDNTQNNGGNGQNGDADKSGTEDDLAQITGGKEAEVEEYTSMLAKITEDNLIQDGLLGKFTPILQSVANEALRKYSDAEACLQAPPLCILERSAILALCKFMCVSQKLCEDNLNLIFNLAHSQIEFGVKANIIITLADLFNRYPNLLNERVKEIFALLHDKQVLVRQQALMVITHLILNDMLKLKGEIVDICKLLEDESDRIKEQVKLFLHELHSKGNHIIYNLFPKAISRLSKEFMDLSKEEFENIARNLLAYIKQEGQTNTLIEQLCKKLKNSTSKIEWRNTAFCISQLKLTEKGFLKLLELYDCYKERLLQSDEVKDYFQQVVTTSKKLIKPELKAQLDEFEMKINLDENAILQLKRDNKILNAKEEVQRIKQLKKMGKNAQMQQQMLADQQQIVANNDQQVLELQNQGKGDVDMDNADSDSQFDMSHQQPQNLPQQQQQQRLAQQAPPVRQRGLRRKRAQMEQEEEEYSDENDNDNGRGSSQSAVVQAAENQMTNGSAQQAPMGTKDQLMAEADRDSDDSDY